MRSIRTATALLCTLAALPAAGQDPGATGSPARNAVYLELLGNGGLYSVNYVRLLTDDVAVRVGVGAWTTDDLFLGEEARKEIVTVPLSASWLLGSGAGRIELGAGVTLGSQSQDIPFEDGSTSSAITSLTGTVGYRYQPARPGFMFRVGFTPFFGLGDEAYPESGFTPSLGLSGGYTF